MREGGYSTYKVNITSDTLNNSAPSKVNSCDKTVEYSTSRIVHITRSNMDFGQN